MKKLILSLIKISVLLFLILVFLDVKLPASSGRICRIYLVDISDSVFITSSHNKDVTKTNPLEFALSFIKWDISNLLSDDMVGIAVFADTISFELKPTPKSNVAVPNSLNAGIDRVNTNMPKAVMTTAKFFPDGYSKEIYIFTDGNNVTDDIDKMLSLAKLEGISVFTIPVGGASPIDFKIESVAAPTAVAANEKFDIAVTISSTEEGRVRVSLEELKRSIDTVVPKNMPMRVVFPDVSITPNKTYEIFTAKVSPLDLVDDCEVNNVGRVMVIKGDNRTKVLYLGRNTQNIPLLLRIMMADTNIHLDSSDKYIAPFPYDCVVINNIPASFFTKEQMESIKTYVEDFGGGLFIVGGPDSYALGGYEDTAIEAVSPLWSAPDERLSTVIVLDSSGSMDMDVPKLNKRKMEIAVDSIGAVVKMLRDNDFISIVTFSDSSNVLVPMTKLNNKSGVLSKLSGLTAYGPTQIIPPLNDAIRQLANAETGRRHILLITDGKSNEDIVKFKEIGETLRQKDITITVIATGEEVGEDKLRSLLSDNTYTYWHLKINDFTELERILRNDIISKKEYLVEKEGVMPSIVDSNHAILKGLDGLPLIQQYNRTSPKKDSIVILSVEKSPLLAVQNYGKGISAALAVSPEKGFAKWEELYMFVIQILSYIKKLPGGDAVRVSHSIESNKIRLTITIKDGDDYINGLKPTADYICLLNNERGSISLDQIASGKYEGIIPNANVALYYISIFADKYSMTTSISVDYSTEFYNIGINLTALERISQETNGKVLRDISGYKTTARKEVPIKKDGKPFFVAAAVILFILDIGVNIFWKL
ncbi:MAG: hypothetical protein A2W05_06840 [Candidatus Schekmanbacteria bacterium RBG_16_38_10]|uniref:VWFA domain-containing protein n=1 Tax=Candidatus Schekmanbacteria bacterium RBG_16_38_10 TaxID=1817879 RepID=A0A1F7RUM5_9BACT|nr:MAG: hypothetical protein A2W05_06840 [Candidatus Schekmanbacteria bacterium RBG_16_38_10]